MRYSLARRWWCEPGSALRRGCAANRHRGKRAPTSIAHIGASGYVGSKILAEALRRGHTVTAIVRHPEKLSPQEGLTALAGDATNAEPVAPLLDLVRRSGVRRFLIVGGAGSLKGPDGVEILGTLAFPAEYRTEATAGRDTLRALQAADDLDWTYLSPSAVIAPGERTGRFRLGEDDLLIGEDGQSRISEEADAIAFVDELENPRHVRRRFTVGY